MGGACLERPVLLALERRTRKQRSLRQREVPKSSPSADVGGVSPSPGADVGKGPPSPGADVGGVSPVLAQMWTRVRPVSPGADVGKAEATTTMPMTTTTKVKPNTNPNNDNRPFLRE